jgi:renalase
MRVCIVGAGICGLWLANRILQSEKFKSDSSSSVFLLEKSRSVGGRMATRRFDSGHFNHGAQFYSLKAAVRPLHKKWLAEGLVEPWYVHNGVERFRSCLGMTALAKSLSTDLDIKLNQKAMKMARTNEGLQIYSEAADATKFAEGAQLEERSFEKITFDILILTTPLPQAIEFIERSDILLSQNPIRNIIPKIRSINYSPAIVALLENVKMPVQSESVLGLSGYIENTPNHEGAERLQPLDIFSISEQFSKGEQKAWAVTMTPEFSERYFEAEELTVLSYVTDKLNVLVPGISYQKMQIKKWRYANPSSTYPELFLELTDGIYLAGDAFGGPSINGAVRSADAVAKTLLAKRFEI